MAATAEAATTAEEDKMAAEGAAIVEAEVVKIAAGVAVSIKKSSKDSKFGIRLLAPTIISV